MSEIRALPACIRGVAIARATVLALAALLLGVVLVSGDSGADPRTPPALPGLPPPFLGTAVSGNGGLTAAVDAYGDVVDLRPGPAGPALIDNPSARQAAGTVPEDTGIVPRLRVGRDGPALPLWEAESVRQHYLRGTNVVETVAYVKEARLIVRAAAAGDALAMELIPGSSRQGRGSAELSVDVGDGLDCAQGERASTILLLCLAGRAVPDAVRDDSRALLRECDRVTRAASLSAHGWTRRARPLGPGAPRWARALYRRSLLSLRALTDERTGAVAAGARDGWAYVWPRDAATAALAYEAAGYRAEARRVARFLDRLPLEAAARFTGQGEPVPGRGPQGDAEGWVAVADRAAGLGAARRDAGAGIPSDAGNEEPVSAWRNRPDYQEGAPGDYLGNALASTWVDGPKTHPYQRFSSRRPPPDLTPFVTPRGLVRVAGDPASGLDSAAAWAVRPFSQRALYPAARRTLLRLLRDGTRFGITPGEGWHGGVDPWTAPTAAMAWSLAALDDRPAALRALADLRRAATPAGDLPERVDVKTGVPTSTTPLAWSHAFTVLALRELWP
jgi:glucoamylase